MTQCDWCGKDIVEGLHRAGKVFCSGHCEIEDRWDNPSIENAWVEL